jgi:hypothetical protein
MPGALRDFHQPAVAVDILDPRERLTTPAGCFVSNFFRPSLVAKPFILETTIGTPLSSEM